MAVPAFETNFESSGLRRRIAVFGVVVVLAIVAEQFAALVVPLGHYIPSERVELDYLNGLITAVIIGASILIWPMPNQDKVHLVRLWAIRCVMVLGFMLAYEWHYANDSTGYFNSSRFAEPPYLHGYEAPSFGNGTANLKHLTWLIAQVIPPAYHGQKVLFAAIGLVASYIIYRAACVFMKRDDVRLLYILELFPSIMFWSSNLNKDPIMLLGIAIYTYGVVALARRRHVVGALLTVAGIVVAMWLRLWMGPIMILPLVGLAIAGSRNLFLRILIPASLAAIFALSFGPLSQRFKIEKAEDLIGAADQLAQTTGWEGGSYIGQPTDISTVGGVLKFAPTAIFTALFRPLPGEVMNIFGLLNGFEDLLLLGLAILPFFRRRPGALREPLIIWALLFVLTWAMAYGIAIYNLGTLVRMKLQILPILLAVLLYLGDFGEPHKRADATE